MRLIPVGTRVMWRLSYVVNTTMSHGLKVLEPALEIRPLVSIILQGFDFHYLKTKLQDSVRLRRK